MKNLKMHSSDNVQFRQELLKQLDNYSEEIKNEIEFGI